MANKDNSPQVWNKLLDDNEYLADYAVITKQRTKIARKWAVGCKKILNVGSGQGYIEDAFNDDIKQNLVNWTALDIAKVGLDKIQERYQAVKCIEGDVLALPFDENMFDLVICMEVLEHIEKSEVQKAYSELLRVGNLKTKYIISVPVYEPVSLINHPVGHYRKYTSKIISSELKQNGFKIIDKKLLYAFKSNYYLKSLISRKTKIRRPNVVMFLCQKS